MANYRTSRILPILLVVIIIIIAIASLVSLARVVFFSASNQNQSTEQVDTSKQELLNTSANHAVTMTVRGPIVADEAFHSYQIDISPNSRSIRTYSGYLDTVVDQTDLGNSVAAYEEFVYALDKADLAKGEELEGDKNDVRGICATGRVYEFSIQKDGKAVKRLWTSTCKGSKGSLDANVNQVTSLFVAQIPGADKQIAKVKIVGGCGVPELPEVETVRRGLSTLIIGKTVISETHDTPKGFPNADTDVQKFLIGAHVTDVRRRAKVLIIDLSGDYSLLAHLKMTGQMVFVGADVRFGAGHPNDSLVHQLPDKSTRVTLTFDDGSQLFFNDQRKFGWVRLLPTIEIPNIDFMKRVGPEPLEADFTAKDFAERFTRRAKTNIKAALLDQSVVAGVGNIYADESLWGAKIHPQRLVSTITPAEFKKLYTALRDVMNLSIEKGGSSNHTYVNAEGKRGSYMNFANVFRREGQACPRCGTTIEKMRVAGRGTHICPYCQKI